MVKMGRYRSSQMNLPNTFQMQFMLKYRNLLEFCYDSDNIYSIVSQKAQTGIGMAGVKSL